MGSPFLLCPFQCRPSGRQRIKMVLVLILLPGGVRGASKAQPARVGDDGTR